MLKNGNVKFFTLGTFFLFLHLAISCLDSRILERKKIFWVPPRQYRGWFTLPRVKKTAQYMSNLKIFNFKMSTSKCQPFVNVGNVKLLSNYCQTNVELLSNYLELLSNYCQTIVELLSIYCQTIVELFSN